MFYCVLLFFIIIFRNEKWCLLARWGKITERFFEEEEKFCFKYMNSCFYIVRCLAVVCLFVYLFVCFVLFCLFVFIYLFRSALQRDAPFSFGEIDDMRRELEEIDKVRSEYKME